MASTIATFLLVCLATAFVCTAIKEDEDRHLLTSTLRLFGVMVAGILAFGAVVQLVTVAAG